MRDTYRFDFSLHGAVSVEAENHDAALAHVEEVILSCKPIMPGGKAFVILAMGAGEANAASLAQLVASEKERVAASVQKAVQANGEKITVYYDRTGVGCYGVDAHGNAWATFQLVGETNTTACALCGTPIKGGWQKGTAFDGEYYCASHIHYVERREMTLQPLQTMQTLAVLQAVAKTEATSDDRGDYLTCPFCTFADYCNGPDEVVHDGDCAIVIAKNLLKELGVSV